MYLGPVYMNWYTKPNIVFSFDDGPAGNYDYAYPYMAARGLVGSVAVNGGSIGGPPKMTAANLVELRDAGWSIHNHTWSHTNLALSTESVIRTAIERNQTWLQGLGLHASGDQCFVLPYGNNSVTIEQIVADYYPYSATAAEGAFNTWDGMPDPYLVFRINHDDPTTSASIIAAIDVAVAKGQTIVLYGHDVQPSPVAASYTLTSVFYPIVDYVAKLVKAGIADNTNLQDAIVGLDGRRRLR
jgi:peptidoglycan/xylan/chitin deacetylase (PgdA/CDA1 family)